MQHKETAVSMPAIQPTQAQGPAAGAHADGGYKVIAAVPAEDMAALMLNDRGMIRDCNRLGEALFRYRRSELVWRHVSMLLPQLTELDLLQNGQPNPRLRFLCRIGRQFLAVTRDGEQFASTLFLNLLGSMGQPGLSLIVRPAGPVASLCRGRPSAG